MMKKFTFLSGIGMLAAALSFAQQKNPSFPRPKPKCSTMEYMQRSLANNPGLTEQWRQEGERRYNEYLQKAMAGDTATASLAGEIIIPIVFHIVDVAAAQAAISDRDIYEQVEILNQDYSGAKALLYKDVIPAEAFNRVGNIPVKFVLAKRTPAGTLTSGIERRTAASPDHISIKQNATGGLDAWDDTKYVNVWVGTFSGEDDGLLGIATFPFTSDEGAQGVVIGTVTLPVAGNTNRLNGGYLPNYSEGATLSHEIGHYFYLFHTFGDANPCNNYDFDIQDGWPLPNGGSAADDTPRERGSDGYIFGNPSRDYNVGCDVTSFGMIYGSYMNYYDDRALFMFTNGQKARVSDCINLYRPGLLTSNGATPPSAVTDAHLVSASVTSNVERPAYVESGTPLSVKLRNSGTTTLTSLTVQVSIDGGAPSATPFAIALTAGNEISLSLAPLTAAPGLHLYRIYSSSPNGGADTFLSNDTLYGFVAIVASSVTAPLSENFTAASFPPANWLTWNPNGDPANAWARSSASGYTAAGAAFMYNYDIAEPGTLDDLVSPAIGFGINDSSLLTFRVAHASYDATDPSYWDGLEVLVSGDGGATYKTAYKKTGDKLRTVTGAVENDFVALPTQPVKWRSDTVNLSGYIQAGKKMFVVFRNTNAYGNNTYIDDISITAAQKVLVPLSLISFTGIKQHGFNQLVWKTSNELNSKTFDLEFSEDGNRFELLTAMAAGRNVIGNSYTYNHLNPAKVNFYRLKMVDISGRFTYSNTVKLTSDGSGLFVYPTPAQDLISVNGLENKGEISILSADGKLMVKQAVNGNAQTLNISLLAKGVYILRYVNGTDVQTKKIIKE